MTLQFATELVLALAAVLLLVRDVRRALLDQLRRPITLLIATLIAVLLVGSLGGRAHPSPWWLVLPALVLAWEVGRGWRRTPRCHLWETGVAAFAASLVLAVVGLGAGGDVAIGMLVASVATSILGVGLLWQSRRREPPPWRADDPNHYERRARQRSDEPDR
jgi:uncharacterized membrane protein AbrB (regulator of aidB expression)